MDKIKACGIRVDPAGLVVALSGKAQETVLRRFANTAWGHRQLLRLSHPAGGSGESCMEAGSVSAGIWPFC